MKWQDHSLSAWCVISRYEQVTFYVTRIYYYGNNDNEICVQRRNFLLFLYVRCVARDWIYLHGLLSWRIHIAVRVVRLTTMNHPTTFVVCVDLGLFFHLRGTILNNSLFEKISCSLYWFHIVFQFDTVVTSVTVGVVVVGVAVVDDAMSKYSKYWSKMVK